MLIKYKHLEKLKAYIWDNGIQTALCVFQVKNGAELIKKYERMEIPRAEHVKDLQKRFCFDMLYYARIPSEFMEELYEYMNDDHIYTALKHILPKLEA